MSLEKRSDAKMRQEQSTPRLTQRSHSMRNEDSCRHSPYEMCNGTICNYERKLPFVRMARTTEAPPTRILPPTPPDLDGIRFNNTVTEDETGDFTNANHDTRRYALSRRGLAGIAGGLSPSHERIRRNVIRQMSPVLRSASPSDDYFHTPFGGSPMKASPLTEQLDHTFENFCDRYRASGAPSRDGAEKVTAQMRPISLSNDSLCEAYERRRAFHERSAEQSRSMGQTGSSSATQAHQHLTGSGSQLSSSFSASFDCPSKIFGSDGNSPQYPFRLADGMCGGQRSPNAAQSRERRAPFSQMLLSVAGGPTGGSIAPQQKSVSITFGTNELLFNGESTSSADGSFFKRYSAALQKRVKEKEKRTAKDKRRPPIHTDSTTSENGAIDQPVQCGCGTTLTAANSASALDSRTNKSRVLCNNCSLHNSVSMHNLATTTKAPPSTSSVATPANDSSSRAFRKKSVENPFSTHTSRNSSRSNQLFLGVSSSPSTSLTPSPSATSSTNQFNYSMNTKNRTVNLSPQKNGQNTSSRRSVTGCSISASARQIITYCMENARGDLAGRVIGRMAHKREDFANFCANMNPQAFKTFTIQLRDYLAEVARSLQSAEKIRELSMEFGRSQVNRRTFGFKADFFSIMADALTTECVFLDAATHQTTDAIEAWSELISIMFSSIRDGYYQQIRLLRRNNTQGLSTGPSSDHSIDNYGVPQLAPINVESLQNG